MRRMKEAKCVHMDHVGAVMDVDYSPTGEIICRQDLMKAKARFSRFKFDTCQLARLSTTDDGKMIYL